MLFAILFIMIEKIIEKFKNYGYDLTTDQANSFIKYYQLLIEWNEKFNLTTILEFYEVVEKHYIDSCAAIKSIPVNAKYCDIGSGAGFPALPLKIMRPDLDVTMMDSVNKKIGFLNHVIAELGLNNAKALHIRAEEAGQGKMRESFDVVTARAVANLSTLSEYCIPLVKKGGMFIAYKAQSEEELKAAENAVKILGGKIRTVENFTLGEEKAVRTIIIIDKINNTDKKYPRGKGKERSAPL